MEDATLIINNFDSSDDKKPEAIIYEIYMKLKLSIWDQIEFLSETGKVEDPQQIMYLIREQVEEAFVKYSPATEFSEERF